MLHFLALFMTLPITAPSCFIIQLKEQLRPPPSKLQPPGAFSSQMAVILIFFSLWNTARQRHQSLEVLLYLTIAG